MENYYVYGHKITEYIGMHIYILEDFISQDVCDELVSYINTINYTQKNIIEGVNYVECYNITINDLKKKTKNNLLEYTKCLYYDHKIYSIVNEIIWFISKINKYLVCNSDTGYGLRKVYGRTAIHVDGINSMLGTFLDYTRHLTIIMGLNDNYDGGIYHFPKQNVSFKLKAGSILLFPPYWTHPHEVSTISGENLRYTINTWALEKFIK